MKELSLVSAAKICEMLGISRATLSRRVEDGTIPAVRIGGLLKFDLQDVIDALKGRRDDGPQLVRGEFCDCGFMEAAAD